MSQDIYTVAVVGGGPAGLAAALAAERAGADVLLAAPPHRVAGAAPDTKTAALFAGSIELLKNLGAWEAIAPASEPISAIRIIDDTGRMLRAPEVLFTAQEVDRDAFGWNVPNAALVSGLLAAAQQPGRRITLLETAGIDTVSIANDAATLTSREGATFRARLVVGADGRNSICRAAAGIGTRTWQYDQAALVTSFRHTRAHRTVSTEFHRPAGPLTTVPLPQDASSLVWVERPAEAQRLSALDDDAFKRELEERLQGLLGELSDFKKRFVFPLSGLTATAYGQNRVALVGEAGHVIPPIGAQGLNLGLRDAAALADCIASALSRGDDPGGAACLDRYSAQRRPDITSRIATVDVLNRSLISGLLPVNLARGLGIVALHAIGPLRRLAIQQGLQPPGALPSLLQADGGQRLADLRAGRGSPASSHAA